MNDKSNSKKECIDVDMLELILNASLSEEEAEVISAHLKECEKCRILLLAATDL